MGYTIDHALANYYSDCLWTIHDSDYTKLEWDASNSKTKPTLEAVSYTHLTLPTILRV